MERLPLHHFPLQNRELEQTDLMLSREPCFGDPFILFGSRDPGSANAMLPIIRSLGQKHVSIGVMTDSRAKEIIMREFSKNFIRYHDISPLSQIMHMKPDTIVVGLTSFQPGIDLALTANAKIDGIPTVWVEDYPGGIFPHYFGELNTIQWIQPDFLCVANEWAKMKELDANPAFPPENVIVTGLPNLDKIVKEDKIGTRSRVREALGISPEEMMVVYMGIPSEANLETLRALVQAMRHFPHLLFRFVNRRHPRDMVDQVFHDSVMDVIRDRIVDTSSFSTDEIGLSADLVVTTYSTTGIESVYRQIPTLHILIPEVMAKAESNNIEDPIVVQDGASPCARTRGEIAPLLDRFFSDRDFLSTLASRMQRWQVDGKAADRIADLVFECARKHHAV